ncbi:hypothetical protein TNCV_4242671 [Trichonephila clavipes]|nr:hypothetical protein TNCV_4242671 [Trichonephila clavipes]
MIACFVEENHENWDRFLHEFPFALRTSVNETTNKTPAELFLGRKIITPFSELINVTEGAEYVGRNIEKLFDEEGRICGNNTKIGNNIIIGKGGKLTSTTTSGSNRTAERVPVRSKQATAVRPCLYYLRSRVKQSEEIPEDRRSIGIDNITQKYIRRRSRSMEALDGYPVDRSE